MEAPYVDSANAAIAKLIAANDHETKGRFLGSAFAVSPTVALTAFHCVGNIGTGAVSVDRVRLEFIAGDSILGVVEKGDPEYDFVVVRLDEPLPAGFALIKLVRGVVPHTRYRSFGFPPQVTLFKMPAVSGTVTNPTAMLANGARALQLYCNELSGQLDLRGMSGAPVVIDCGRNEGAVGIVRQLQPRADDATLAVGNFFAACPVKAVIDAYPELDEYALDRTPSHIVNKVVQLVDREAPQQIATPKTAPIPSASPWLRSEAWKPTSVSFVSAGASDEPLRTGERVWFRFERRLQTRWKDPMTSRLLAVERKGEVRTVARAHTVVAGKAYDCARYLHCIPGFDVDIEWRGATRVWGSLWGPIKLKSVRAFIDRCGDDPFAATIVHMAMSKHKRAAADAQIRIQCDAYDAWLRHEWPYYKGLESALSRNGLYQTATALQLRQEGHLLPIANELVRTRRLEAMIPYRFRYLIGDRPIEPLDVQLVLEGLIDEYHER